MESLFWMVHVVAAAGVIGLVLMQHGKGADMGAAFGSGASGSLFGSSGSANFLSRATAILATVFFITSMSLTYMSAHRAKPVGLMDAQKPAVQESVPTPAAPAGTGTVAPQGGAGSKAGEIPK